MSEEIRKIMEREDARKLMDDFKLKICGVDLEKLCSDDDLVEEAKEKLKSKDKTEAEIKTEIIAQKYKRTLENAVMCGLVFWSEEKNCLCQKLIKPVKSGDQELSVLQYIYQLRLVDAKNQSDDPIQVVIDNLSRLTGRSKPIVGQIETLDIDIATACISFFGM